MEIFLESARVAQFSKADQDEARKLDTNLLEEKSNKALANIQKY
jgi:predicted RNA methylase